MAEKHYFEQKAHTSAYLLPYFERHIPGFRRKKVLEAGCAEGGFLAVLQQEGIACAGVELEASRVKTALEKNPSLRLVTGDITDPAVAGRLQEQYDLIVLRDVIEHIPDRRALFTALKTLLRPDGRVYITFPPRFSPFAGHQQNGRSLLRYVPFLQLWPPALLRPAGKIFGERPYMIDFISHNFRTGLTVHTFERLYREAGFTAEVNELFMLRPVYRIRFGIKPRCCPNMPLLRETAASGCEVLLRLTGDSGA